MPVIKTEHTASILLITISRPEALNALNVQVLNELRSILQEAYQDTDKTKGIIITGEGEKAFAAGADIKELTTLSKEQAFEMVQNVQKLFSQIEAGSIPVIAAVNGFALGGGCELAMACHMRIAIESARFGQPEVNLGIIPGYGGTQRLAQLTGRAKALELILTGDLIGAEEAKSIGLVNHVVKTHEELMTLSKSILTKIISKGPIAVASAIKSINAGYSFEKSGYQAEAENFAACVMTEDFKEGTAAFIEKRKPVFKGK